MKESDFEKAKVISQEMNEIRENIRVLAKIKQLAQCQITPIIVDYDGERIYITKKNIGRQSVVNFLSNEFDFKLRRLRERFEAI